MEGKSSLLATGLLAFTHLPFIAETADTRIHIILVQNNGITIPQKQHKPSIKGMGGWPQGSPRGNVQSVQATLLLRPVYMSCCNLLVYYVLGAGPGPQQPLKVSRHSSQPGFIWALALSIKNNTSILLSCTPDIFPNSHGGNHFLHCLFLLLLLVAV